MELENKKIYLGDVVETLKNFPNESINVIVTSPPYWGLRDYGISGQWGNEPMFQEYLFKMRVFMEECKRILRKDGTCWINLGDCYNVVGDHTKVQNSGKQELKKGSDYIKTPSREVKLIGKKSLFGIPQRFYINCIDSGWIARNYIIWYKRNHMPNSVKDRLTNAYEAIMFFTKSPKYYFNLDPIRMTPKTKFQPFNVRVRDAINGKALEKMGESDKTYVCSEVERQEYDSNGVRKQDSVIRTNGELDLTKKGFNERWKNTQRETIGSGNNTMHVLRGLGKIDFNHPKGKNPSDMWDITTKPFKGKHFATFPPDLIERILKCSCPQNGWVLDPFIGSGTTGLVSERLGLNWVGIDIKQEYIDLAYNRIFVLKK